MTWKLIWRPRPRVTVEFPNGTTREGEAVEWSSVEHAVAVAFRNPKLTLIFGLVSGRITRTVDGSRPLRPRIEAESLRAMQEHIEQQGGTTLRQCRIEGNEHLSSVSISDGQHAVRLLVPAGYTVASTVETLEIIFENVGREARAVAARRPRKTKRTNRGVRRG